MSEKAFNRMGEYLQLIHLIKDYVQFILFDMELIFRNYEELQLSNKKQTQLKNGQNVNKNFGKGDIHMVNKHKMFNITEKCIIGKCKSKPQ